MYDLLVYEISEKKHKNISNRKQGGDVFTS